jgi:hypothetical protein
MSRGTPSGQPNAGWDDSDTNNGGGFITVRHDDAGRAELEALHAAHIRARFGDEAVHRMERSRALIRNPRPLTDEETAVLWGAVTPLLRDMEATGQAVPDIRPEAHEDRGDDAVCAWIQESGDRYGQGIAVLLFCSPGDRLCFLAEQL